MRYIDKQTLIEIHAAYEDLILGNNELAYKQLGKILSNEQLILHCVVKQSEQLPDENLYQPCEGCTTSCKNWEVFFCKKLVG